MIVTISREHTDIEVDVEYIPGSRDYISSGAWHPGDPPELRILGAVDDDDRSVELDDGEIDRVYELAREAP